LEEIGLELHHLDELDKSDVQRCRTDIIGETGGAFHAGHVHANNFCSVAIVGGFPAPESLELTSKRSGGAGALHTVCPTPIDMPNYPQWPDYLLWYFPFCRAPARCVFLADRDTLPPGDPRGMFCCFRWFSLHFGFRGEEFQSLGPDLFGCRAHRAPGVAFPVKSQKFPCSEGIRSSPGEALWRRADRP
jgi:hypothetical protein